MSGTLANGHVTRAEEAAPLLTMSGAGKRFADGTVALARVDLAVTHGEFVGIVGPSGCGKSTLLRLAAGLTGATEGSVHRATEHIEFVFQTPALLPWRTVRSNIELPGELRGLPRAERRRRSEEAIRLVGLEEFADHRPRTLSGGMQMRVSLARSLTMRPELFFFDEPFGALDEITRRRLGDELLALFTSRRFAALFVTHSLDEAVFLSSRVVVLSERPGRVLCDIAVPLEYPRSPELRYGEEFSKIARIVENCLHGGG